MPAKYDLNFWLGNDAAPQFTFKDDTGALVDLTGSTLVFRAVKSDGLELFRKELSIPTPSNGVGILNISAAETRTIPLSSSVAYEIERRIGGQQTTLLFGNITTSGGVNDD